MTFEMNIVPRILFGRGQRAKLGELASQWGRRPLVVHNGSDAIAQEAAGLLAGTGLAPALHRQRGEPTVADVDRGLAAARAHAADTVIGLGGGSAIDCAKAIAGLMGNGGGALDYMEVVGAGRKITKPAAPWIAVPVTAGTGAEATRNAVIGAPEKKFKASIRSELLLPRVAVVDAELGVGVPPHVTAASGMDALCQLIESYTSKGANPLTDALALQGIRLAARSLRRAFAAGDDIDAREDMALAALLSGITLTNAGLGAVHGIAAPLGAAFPVPHGVACAALLPGVMAANVNALRRAGMEPALHRYAEIDRALAGDERMPDDKAIEASVVACRELARDLGIARLGGYGLRPEDAQSIAPLAKKASSMRFNPVELEEADVAKVIAEAL